jgi:hypothetical protein
MNASTTVSSLFNEIDDLHQNINIYHILIIYDDDTITDVKSLQLLLHDNDYSFINISKAFSYICNIMHLESYYRIFFLHKIDLPYYVDFKNQTLLNISAFVSMSKDIQSYFLEFINENVAVNKVPHLILL